MSLERDEELATFIAAWDRVIDAVRAADESRE
jgi:hypothetical protein